MTPTVRLTLSFFALFKVNITSEESFFFFLTRSVYAGSRKSCDHRLCQWCFLAGSTTLSDSYSPSQSSSGDVLSGIWPRIGSDNYSPQRHRRGEQFGVQCLQGHFRASAAGAHYRNIDPVITMIARLLDPLLLGLNKWHFSLEWPCLYFCSSDDPGLRALHISAFSCSQLQENPVMCHRHLQTERRVCLCLTKCVHISSRCWFCAADGTAVGFRVLLSSRKRSVDGGLTRWGSGMLDSHCDPVTLCVWNPKIQGLSSRGEFTVRF